MSDSGAASEIRTPDVYKATAGAADAPRTTPCDASGRHRRIAHVIPWVGAVGGTEHATLRIARAVEPAGFHSTVFCFSGDSPVRRFFVGEGLAVASFAQVEPSIRRPRSYVRAARDLARQFRQRQIDLVHCADVLAAHYVALAGRLAEIPVLSHVRSRQDRISRRDRLFLLPVNRWAFVSRDTWRNFGHRVSSRSGVVIYDGIDVPALAVSEAAAVRAELGVSPDSPIIGMVARVSPQKDFLTLVRASKKIVAEYPTARFVIVGDHELEPVYRDHYAHVRGALRDHDVEANFVFTGFRSDVSRLIAAMDVFVLCTHTEGLPLVLLEGMAQAKPTIATAVGGIPEIIRHDENGLLHQHEDADELGRHIVSVLDDPELGLRLGRAARRDVEADWTSERFAREMVRLYSAVLGDDATRVRQRATRRPRA